MLEPSYNDWTLVSLSPLAPWLQALVIVGALAAAALVMWSYRQAPRRALLIALRVVGVLLVLGLLLEPAVQLRAVRKIKNRLAVVVDRSRSMTLAGPEGRTRYEAMMTMLEGSRNQLARLGEEHVLEWLDLAGPITPAELAKPPAAETTDLLTALERAKSSSSGRPLAGVVVLSDGADNVALEGPTRGELAVPAQKRLAALGVPVNTIDVSRAAAFQDLLIADVVADEFAFVHNTIEVQVTVEAVGYESMSVPVTLKRGADVIDTQEVALSSGRSAKVVFKTKPDQIGEFVYSVSVPTAAGEALVANNTRTFVVQVIRDKIRVLQVAGRPSWDERFLRQHLKENPNVDLISFFILRTPSDVSAAPEGELSLIPFPVDRLFTTELKSFDVVIFQNFDYRPYGMARYLPNIRDAVRGGLGFVMIGGEQSFAGGGYLGTEIEEILPVVLTAEGLEPATQPPVLTESGRRHPITDLARGAGNNEKLWQSLPTWTMSQRTGGLMPAATALVTSPTLRGPDGQPLPLVAVSEIGEGRSMAVATDSTWRWRFSSARDGGAAQRAYHRFWSNALRWLVKDPEHSRIRVLPEARRFDVGRPVGVTATLRGPNYQPVAFGGLRVSLEHTSLGVLRVDDVTTDEQGGARLRFDELPEGAYRVTATVVGQTGPGTPSGHGVFVIEERSSELTRGAPRSDLLAALARDTGGAALALDPSAWDEIETTDPDLVEVDRRRNIELWDNGWALAAAVVLLAADWAVRRRSGYL